MSWAARLGVACRVLLIVACAAPAFAASDPVNLPIGDPARKDRVLQVATDTLIDTSTGLAITPQDLVERLRDVQILLLGESHTAAEYHRVQRQVIAALQLAGRPITIGLEMFPYTQQAALDAWRTGSLSEQAFLDRADWYQHWGYPWAYYRDIFLFAREYHLAMAAVNAPRAVVTAVRKKGFKNLTPEEAAHIPADIDVDNADHLTLFKAYFDDGDGSGGGSAHTSGMTDETWKAMLSAQATWDATMGYHAMLAWRAAKDPAAIVIVLAGSGHVAYDLGIKRQVGRWFDGRVATLLPVEVDGDAHTTAVRASYANFVWGVPKEASPRYPALGLSVQPSASQATTGAAGGTAIVVAAVEDDSPSARGGVQAGDELIAFDRQALASRTDLDRLMGDKEWGDAVDLTIRRAGQERVLRIPLKRSAP